MSTSARDDALLLLRQARAQGRAILGAGAASGLVAVAAENGGSDLIVVYNSGRFRRAGLSSLSGVLPFADANAVVREMLPEILAAVQKTPVIAGICATDPFRDIDSFLVELRELGVAGVQNFPTIGLYGDAFRADLERTGISFEREVELMRAGRRRGLLTCAFVTKPSDAERMALAGADVIAPLLGVTHTGSSHDALIDAAARVDEIAFAARGVRDDLLVLFHGGPAATPGDVGEILRRADGADGFFAASAVERQPVEKAVEEAARSFSSLPLPSPSPPSSPPARLEVPDFHDPAPVLPVELTEETLPDYLRRRGLIEGNEEVEIEELGGGLSNVVLRWRTSGEAGIVKQSRPRLRVADEWLVDVRRVFNERDAIMLLAERVTPGSIPALTFSDDEAMAIGMEAAPASARLWKPDLLAGTLDPSRARQAGRLLREIHDATRDDRAVAARFAPRPLLDQNRLDPWYRAAASSHPDLAAVIEYAIDRLLAVRHVLVHGDFVPKNMFLLERGLLLLDYEVVHYGNPGYDVATFVNHMLLKGFRSAERRRGFAGMAHAFWHSYKDGLARREVELCEQESILQLGALMLARVDGKSRVEYLVDHPGAEEAREFARWLLRSRPDSLDEAIRCFSETRSSAIK